MKKGSFKIRVGTCLSDSDFETVTGYIGNDFGINHNAKYKSQPWTVTHLKSGMVVRSFEKVKTAKDFVQRMETAIFPLPWDQLTAKNSHDCNLNLSKMKEILDSMNIRY